MSNHPLFSDITLPLSVTLAATIGLEDAVLLTVFNQAAMMQPDSSRHGIRLSRETVRQQLPFWDDVSIRRTLASLIDKGLLQLHSPMYPESITLVVSFAGIEPASQVSPSAATAERPAAHQQWQPQSASARSNSSTVAASQPTAPSTPARHQPLGQDWQPSQDTLIRLQQHGIPQSFVWAQRDTFLLQGQEQGANRNDWNTRFFRHVKTQWVYAQNDAQRSQKQKDKQLDQWRDGSAFQVAQEEAGPIPANWRPSEDALQILQRSGVDDQYINDAIPEFVLYWQERGDVMKTWNSKFIQHIRMQWARYSASMEHSNVPLPIERNWQPSQDCYDILAMSHIDSQFARERVAEFVLYWRESGQVHNSWNSRFLQYIKQQWGKRLAQPGAANGTASNTSATEPGYSTAEASVRRLNDTSW